MIALNILILLFHCCALFLVFVVVILVLYMNVCDVVLAADSIWPHESVDASNEAPGVEQALRNPKSLSVCAAATGGMSECRFRTLLFFLL